MSLKMPSRFFSGRVTHVSSNDLVCCYETFIFIFYFKKNYSLILFCYLLIFFRSSVDFYFFMPGHAWLIVDEMQQNMLIHQHQVSLTKRQGKTASLDKKLKGK
jgi:hypothetical protein